MDFRLFGSSDRCRTSTRPHANRRIARQHGRFGRNGRLEWRSGAESLHDQRQDSAADGWQFPNTTDGGMDTSRVVLRGPACDRLKSNPSTVVDIILGCAPLE